MNTFVDDKNNDGCRSCLTQHTINEVDYTEMDLDSFMRNSSHSDQLWRVRITPRGFSVEFYYTDAEFTVHQRRYFIDYIPTIYRYENQRVLN